MNNLLLSINSNRPERDLVRKVASSAEVSMKVVHKVVKAWIQTVKEELLEGKKVVLFKLGTLKIQKSEMEAFSKVFTDFKKEEPPAIPSKKVKVRFLTSKGFLKELNKNGEKYKGN